MKENNEFPKIESKIITFENEPYIISILTDNSGKKSIRAIEKIISIKTNFENSEEIAEIEKVKIYDSLDNIFIETLLKYAEDEINKESEK